MRGMNVHEEERSDLFQASPIGAMKEEISMTPARILKYAAATVMALGLLASSATNTAAAETGPDLDAGTIDGPLYVQAGQKVHFETCVENVGDQGSGGFNIAWYVSGQRLGY